MFSILSETEFINLTTENLWSSIIFELNQSKILAFRKELNLEILNQAIKAKDG